MQREKRLELEEDDDEEEEEEEVKRKKRRKKGRWLWLRGMGEDQPVFRLHNIHLALQGLVTTTATATTAKYRTVPCAAWWREPDEVGEFAIYKNSLTTITASQPVIGIPY
ncbi:hypothetical protein TWF788_001535 [Orbilia oligospora]|uniref:Uncharacterized protein n=1 Tax=Orbilia oligospora TaxID=2813651 RepID=A0A7C8K4D7_ORBOL|nr:hypothetical protein TWF788_001535 [Orbilia oligospora]